MQNFDEGSNLLCGCMESAPLDYHGSPMTCFIKKNQAWRLDEAFLGHLCFCALFLWRLHTSVLEDETRKSSSPLGLLISTNHASFLQQHRRPHPTHILLHRPETTWKYQGHSYKCQAWFSSAYSGIFLRLMKMVMWRHKFYLLQVDIDKKKRLGVALSEEFGSCMFCLLW